MLRKQSRAKQQGRTQRDRSSSRPAASPAQDRPSGAARGRSPTAAFRRAPAASCRRSSVAALRRSSVAARGGSETPTLDAAADSVDVQGPELSAGQEGLGLRARGRAARIDARRGADSGSFRFGEGEADAGSWENEDGSRRWGARASVATAGVDGERQDQIGYGGSAGSASAEASWGDDGATWGAQANAAEVNVQNDPDGDPTRYDDLHVRGGVSAGAGLEVRGHWGDVDGDHAPEYGFGADLGPISFDVTTEIGAPENPVEQPETPRERRRREAAERTARAVEQGEREAPDAPDRVRSVDRESALDALSVRTGHDRHEYMTLGLDGRYQEHPRAIRRDVRRFQEENGLPVTGELDEQTVAALGG